MVKMHPDSGLLTEYSSGGLTPAQSVAMSAHLHFCDTCRDRVQSLEEIGGVLLEQGATVAVEPDSLANVFAKIDETTAAPEVQAPQMSVSDELKRLPKLVQRLIPGGEAQWQFLSPSLNIARIPIGETKCELALHKIRPGGTAPEHDHKGQEITVVLQGSFSDDDGVYHEGDFIVREPGDVHTPMATQNELCICLSVCEAPIRMVGPFKRLLNPFISFRPA